MTMKFVMLAIQLKMKIKQRNKRQE
jgi:hypothetical protein